MIQFSFGQFYPADSVIHKLDSRTKLLGVIALIAALFIPSAGNFIPLSFTAISILVIYLLSKVPLRLALKSVKSILPIIILMSILNIFYTDEGDVLLSFWKITITTGGLWRALFMIIRIVFLIIVTSLLTYTTNPIDLTDGLERLLSPLKIFKIPVHDLAMIMTIALRFIPTLMEEANKIIAAQKSRGADIDTGSLIHRIKALIPILIPLFVSAIKRATELATAMDCRCYCGGEGRTRMKQMKLKACDYISFFICAVIITASVLLNLV